MKIFLKFLLLVIVLNVVRYVIAGPIALPLFTNRVFTAMQENATVFNTTFSGADWATSFFYNFMMWLTAAWVFLLMHRSLKGHMVVKSLKIFGLMFLMFASISAIYMNHYSHTKAFYLYNILDGLIAYSVVAVANGLLYPLFFKRELL